MSRLIKENKALWELSLTCPHDEAYRLKNIDSTPFINLAWLI